MKRYVLDACALITFLRDEPGANLLDELFAKSTEANFNLHSINLGEVYYDTLRTSGREIADQLLLDIKQFIAQKVTMGFMVKA